MPRRPASRRRSRSPGTRTATPERAEPAAPDRSDQGGGLVRVRLDLAYDGTDFSGWAAQPGRRTVQGVLSEALTRIVRAPVVLTVAGRTDAGVHATGQVAHADLPVVPEPRRLNGVLPADIRVMAATAVPGEFDARFSALWRRYVYRICDGVPNPLRRRYVLARPRSLDVEVMARAAAKLVGEHDYVAFCRRREGATSVRRLISFDVAREQPEIACTVEADAFCHSMVRSLVGALLAVGEGARDEAWPASLLERTDRAGEVAVAPPHGLTLVAVGYPPDAELAARAVVTRRLRGQEAGAS